MQARVGPLLILVLLVGAAVYVLYPSSQTNADTIVETCATHPQGAMTCYEKEVPKLYPEHSIPQLLELVREIRTKDPSYQFCHVLAHKLGEAVVAENPEGWLDAIPMNPSDGLCSNGFIHGVIVGRFRNDVLDDAALTHAVSDFKRACESRAGWNASPLDRAICYHGLGHLFMFITNAEIPRALDVCDAVTKGPNATFLRVCQEGVFMQIYQPLEPDDFALMELLPEKPTKENYRRLCAAYENNEDEGACLREAWPLFGDGIRSGRDVKEFCANHPGAIQTNACFDTVAAIVGRMSLDSNQKAADACAYFPDERQALCFTVTAQAILEEDRTSGERAVALCNKAPREIAQQCLSTLAGRVSFIFPPGSSDGKRFCSQLPEDVRSVCARED